jgi:hypothetical protein
MLFAGISDDERAMLRRLLNQMLENMSIPT